MKSAAKIDRFLEAMREVAALRQAVEDDGNPRKEALRLALARRIEAERSLTGGELGAARRILAERTQPCTTAE